MSEHSYELRPDELVVGGYNIDIYDASHEMVATTFFIAKDWDTAKKVAKVGFQSEDWKNACPEGYTRTVDISDV